MKESTELNALISLADEPDEKLYDQIRSRILSYGTAAIPSLESAWEASFDDSLQQRLIQLIHQIQQESLYAELYQWSQFGYDDLLRGYMLVTRFQYPDLDVDSLTREVGRIVQQLWLELNTDLTPLEKVKVMNHVFYDINHFSGNTTNIHLPENFYLKNLLESKKGNPLSLGIFYMIIAKSMRIPIFGIDLPKHFILAYTDESKQTLSADDVVFYLNPFNKGAVFTKNEIDLYIKQLRIETQQSFYAPCSNKVIITRLINGLAESYILSGNNDKADELNQLLKALE
ncbi:MAG: transglutaminase-like domain-containing protein [Bacteroidetes bacterium]|nr:transglutaminase-like domain-containing protein [Bacteroidota bacterium]MBU1581044.1 transglutaminase-like domain-containing protein [Bacteroidota bacterium]MBU2558311.1 transglutaminase-like domain-containing protein [Bacteroidota bacterium]